jgi:hypothetical protein
MSEAAAVNLEAKLGAFSGHRAPRIVSRFNDCDVMVVKAPGAFVWHRHDDTDDLFLVIRGQLQIGMPEGDVTCKRLVRPRILTDSTAGDHPCG